jgi:hypothetical protein
MTVWGEDWSLDSPLLLRFGALTAGWAVADHASRRPVMLMLQRGNDNSSLRIFVSGRRQVELGGGGGVGLDWRMLHGDGREAGRTGSRWRRFGVLGRGLGRRKRARNHGTGQAVRGVNKVLFFLSKTRPLDGEEMGGLGEVRRFHSHRTQICSIYLMFSRMVLDTGIWVRGPPPPSFEMGV